MLRPKKAAVKKDPKPAPQDDIQEKVAQAMKRREIEKEERRAQRENEKVKYPEDEEAEEEEKKKKEETNDKKLSRGGYIFSIVMAIIFISLPMSDDDFKGAGLVAAFNALWIFLLAANGWLDYALFVGTNVLLAVYANKIVSEAHLIPGLLPPEQWAALIGSNGSILFAYWWYIIRKAPDDEKEMHWNIVTVGLFFLDCIMGVCVGAITVQHLLLVFGRMRNLLLTGAV